MFIIVPLQIQTKKQRLFEMSDLHGFPLIHIEFRCSEPFPEIKLIGEHCHLIISIHAANR